MKALPFALLAILLGGLADDARCAPRCGGFFSNGGASALPRDAGQSEVEAVRGGFLMIGPRPRLKDIAGLKAAGFTHVATILAESEGARPIEGVVEASGMEWLWMPLASAHPPSGLRARQVASDFVSSVAALFGPGQHNKIYLHCSTGLHRAGMITYAVLRRLGYAPLDSMLLLRSLRPVTARELGQEGVEWGDSLIPNHLQGD